MGLQSEKNGKPEMKLQLSHEKAGYYKMNIK